MGLPNEDLKSRLLQHMSILLREAPIANLYKVMIEGSVGALWRTYGDLREVKVFDRAGGD